MSGPVPSQLVLLGDLPHCTPGTKVRFLGCVDEYVVKTANLRLRHDFHASGAPAIANVNVEHVLERLKHDQVDVGCWLNVMGYIERRSEAGIFVQAMAIWSAGNIDLEAYTNVVKKRQLVG
ncbi:hypothetical protein ACN47E_007392 [Coniothyrium glycines]